MPPMPPAVAWIGGYDPMDDYYHHQEAISHSPQVAPPEPEPIDFGTPRALGYGRSLVMGRFDPLHHGHQYLIEVAATLGRSLTVCVVDHDHQAAVRRWAWISELYPHRDVRILTLEQGDPFLAEGQAAPSVEALRTWTARLLRQGRLPPIDRVVASEAYMGTIAGCLGAEFVLLDPLRRALPLHGSDIRAAPQDHLHVVPDPVRAALGERLVVLGPATSARKRLAQALADELGGLHLHADVLQGPDDRRWALRCAIWAGARRRGVLVIESETCLARADVVVCEEEPEEDEAHGAKIIVVSGAHHDRVHRVLEELPAPGSYEDLVSRPPDVPERRGHALVVGRFSPPHHGHQLLLDAARCGAETTTVALLRLDDEAEIEPDTRRSWITQMAPDVEIVETGRDLEGTLRDVDNLRLQLASPVDRLVSGDLRSQALAQELGASHWRLDVSQVPGDSRSIRDDLAAHWDDLVPCARHAYVRRVVLLGPESSGKSTIARQVAAQLGTCHQHELTGIWAMRWPDGVLRDIDIQPLARLQIASELVLARFANRVLVVDGDLMSIYLWSKRLFEEVPDWIAQSLQWRHVDLVVTTDDAVPFVGPDDRHDPEARAAFARDCRELVDLLGLERLAATGDDLAARHLLVRRRIEDLLAAPWSVHARAPRHPR